MDQGDFVAQNVRLARMLSAGGMGSVWVADHLTLNTRVAVKFMSEEMAEHPEALSRFKREASASARVKSPHIVQVFDHGVTSNGVPYIVMELLHAVKRTLRAARLGRRRLTCPGRDARKRPFLGAPRRGDCEHDPGAHAHLRLPHASIAAAHEGCNGAPHTPTGGSSCRVVE